MAPFDLKHLIFGLLAPDMNAHNACVALLNRAMSDRVMPAVRSRNGCSPMENAWSMCPRS